MISSNVISTWMRFNKIKNDTKTMNVFTQINARFFKIFLLKLNRETRNKINLNLTKHIKNHIKFNSLRLSKIITKANRDSREYSLNEMWRDVFKRQLKLMNLHVDFLIMKMSSKSFNELLIYDLKNMSTIISWIKVQKYFFNVNFTKFIFVYILHVVNEKDFDFEYTNLLLIIQNDIEFIANKNIVEKSLKINSIKIANDKNIDHKKLFVLKLNQFLKKFLFDRHIFFRMKSISKIIFIITQHEKMLKYYNNFDVFIVDDLLRYQHFVLNTLCEKMSRAIKKNNFMKLSKTFREKFQKIIKREKYTFISAEICIIFFITLWRIFNRFNSSQ
jgi:hypothetical protein